MGAQSEILSLLYFYFVSSGLVCTRAGPLSTSVTEDEAKVSVAVEGIMVHWRWLGTRALLATIFWKRRSIIDTIPEQPRAPDFVYRRFA